MHLQQVIEKVYANAKTEPPAIGIDKAGATITEHADKAAELGESASRVYASIVGLALDSVAKGFGPLVFHWALAKDVTGQLEPGETPAVVGDTLAAAGLASKLFVKGRLVWVPAALGRSKPGKVTKTGTDTAGSFVRSLLSGGTIEPAPVAKPKPEPKPKAKPQLIGKALADLAKS